MLEEGVEERRVVFEKPTEQVIVASGECDSEDGPDPGAAVGIAQQLSQDTGWCN